MVKLLTDQLPLDQIREFNINVFRGPKEIVISTIEQYTIDIDSVEDEEDHQTLLSNCVSGRKYGTDNLDLCRYFIKKGANPNIQDKTGNSALHLAMYYQDIEVVEILLEAPILVNQKAEGGYTTYFVALKHLYSELAPRGIDLKKRCLTVLEKLLVQGVDLDIVTSYGTTARQYYFSELASVHQLHQKYEELDIPKQDAKNLRPPSTLKHPEVCKEIWSNYVPRNGEADTVIGEMLRAVEKLRDEAQRNGNGNFGEPHKNLAKYLRTTILSYQMFDIKEVKEKTQLISKKKQPYLKDDAYDFLCDCIAEIYLKYPTPVYR